MPAGIFSRETAVRGWTPPTWSFRDCWFQSCQFRDCDFSGAAFYGCAFSDCLMERCRLSAAYWRDCRLSGCKWDGADLRRCPAGRTARWRRALLRYVNFTSGVWEHFSVKNCDFTEVCHVRDAAGKK